MAVIKETTKLLLLLLFQSDLQSTTERQTLRQLCIRSHSHVASLKK